MTTVLVIAGDAALRTAWGAAVRSAGFVLRQAPSILPAIDVLATEPIDGVLLDARNADDLTLFATLSAYRPMPTTMIVSDLDPGIACRARAAAIRTSDHGAARLVARLGNLLEVRAIASPSNLPIRLAAVAEKWTFRGAAILDHL